MPVNLQNNLRARREAAGWKLYELAHAAGVSAAAISVLERGLHQPRASTLDKLNAALGTTGYELFPFAEPSVARFMDRVDEALRRLPPEASDWSPRRRLATALDTTEEQLAEVMPCYADENGCAAKAAA